MKLQKRAKEQNQEKSGRKNAENSKKNMQKRAKEQNLKNRENEQILQKRGSESQCQNNVLQKKGILQKPANLCKFEFFWQTSRTHL